MVKITIGHGLANYRQILRLEAEKNVFLCPLKDTNDSPLQTYEINKSHVKEIIRFLNESLKEKNDE